MSSLQSSARQPTAVRSADARRRLTATGIAVAFLILAGYGAAHHELWRDELEIWLLARDSVSLADLVRNMNTSGHPAAWYLLNFILSRLTRNPVAMQALNVLIGVATVWTLVRFSPFRSHERLLLAFSYFQLYEFTIISRAYGLQMLCAYVFCTLYSRRRAPLGQVLALILLAHTTLYGTMVAGLCGLLLAWRRWWSGGAGTRAPGRVGWSGTVAVLLGATLAFLQVLIQSLRIGQAHAAAQRPQAHDLRWLLDAIGKVGRGFAPLPDPSSTYFWNSNLLDLAPDGGLVPQAVLALLCLGAAVILLWPRKEILGMFALGSTVMLSITLFVWHGYNRHHGQVFLLFVVCAWLCAGHRGDDAMHATRRWAKAARYLLAGMLIVQTAAAAVAYDRDLRQPFSHAAHVAEYLRGMELDEPIIVGSYDYTAQPITAYLDGSIYYAESRRFGTFMRWGKQRRMIPPAAVVETAIELADSTSRPVILVLCYRLGMQNPGDVLIRGEHRLVYLTSFEGAAVPDENYHLYRIGRGHSAFTANPPQKN